MQQLATGRNLAYTAETASAAGPGVPMRQSDLEKEEMLLALQDVLTSVASGHPENLRCPLCEKGNLDAEMGDDGWVRVQCPQCGLNFEGLVANPEETYTPTGKGKVRETFG